ncbi:MAG: radical SAM protein [Deltaproteobacteria bacterium]|nr:radical SAM protein [Deltaproteobacteria bacterium]
MSSPSERFLPKWIAWETTRRCNLSCIHCRSNSGTDAAAAEFSTAEAFALIDAIRELSAPVLVLTGGEPLLRDDLCDIARYGTRQGLRVCLATNGTLLTDSRCQALRESGIRMVSLSLDGASKAVHDDFRRCPGAFDGVLRGIETLRRNGLPFLINSSFTKRNRHDIAATFQLAKKLGASAWYLFMVVPTGRGRDILQELIPAAEYEQILRWHLNQERQEETILMRPTCAPHYFRIIAQAGDDAGQRRRLSFATGENRGCLAGQSICLIDAEGELKPCSYFLSSVGNVRRTSFRDLWFHAETLLALRDPARLKGKCGVCEYAPVCGGCRARADAVFGDYLAEEPYCSYLPPGCNGVRHED